MRTPSARPRRVVIGNPRSGVPRAGDGARCRAGTARSAGFRSSAPADSGPPGRNQPRRLPRRGAPRPHDGSCPHGVVRPRVRATIPRRHFGSERGGSSPACGPRSADATRAAARGDLRRQRVRALRRGPCPSRRDQGGFRDGTRLLRRRHRNRCIGHPPRPREGDRPHCGGRRRAPSLGRPARLLAGPARRCLTHRPDQWAGAGYLHRSGGRQARCPTSRGVSRCASGAISTAHGTLRRAAERQHRGRGAELHGRHRRTVRRRARVRRDAVASGSRRVHRRRRRTQ
ncbi:hypothetical protein SRABI128_00599 [Microbacterium sp. Bi128]|nr:hypothetical protein SRABI128_00599 [Microbacterium sp. Bi128]